MIKKAEQVQFQEVRAFYHAVIDGIGGAGDSAGWIKDVYPSPDYLRSSIQDGELYIALLGREIIGAMIVNHRYNDAYKQVRWPTQADDTQVTVVHTLGIRPPYTGKGYAAQMVRFAVGLAREDRQKAIRLDVLKGNLRAKRLYTKMGFRYVQTVPMFYEDTGWTDFELYELSL